MTNNYERTPVFANLVYSDPKSDCKYLLGKQGDNVSDLLGDIKGKLFKDGSKR